MKGEKYQNNACFPNVVEGIITTQRVKGWGVWSALEVHTRPKRQETREQTSTMVL